LKTGKPLTLPAYEPVPVFQVELKDGDVHIDPSVKLTV
jgi:3-phenylpropionate/trans-cinnamate dioxygenase ferredoxin subunit